MGEDRMELLQGTLDLLILKALALEPLHGWAVSERLQQFSDDALRVGQGALYPALHRLESKGWIKAEWGTSDNNRKAKYYELTRTGRKQLEAETHPQFPACQVAAPDFFDWQRQAHSFGGLAAHTFGGMNKWVLKGDGPAGMVQVVQASASLYPLLGVEPLLGRWYTAEEDQQKAAVAVLSEALWRSLRAPGRAHLTGKQLLGQDR